MTVQAMIEQVFRDSGEPSDLMPYDTPGDETTFNLALPGSVKLLSYLNTGIVRIAHWVFRDGRNLRLRGMLAKAYFRSRVPLTLTLVSGSTTSLTFTNSTMSAGVADQLRGWIVEFTEGTGVGQKRIVTSCTAGAGNFTIAPHEDWDTAPDATTVIKAYKNFFLFNGASTVLATRHIAVDAVTQLQDVMKVRDITSQVDLTPADKTEVFTASLMTAGIPTIYRIMGNQLEFDVPLNEDRSYELIYLRHPTALSTATQIPDIPLQYHEAVCLWAIHNVQRMNSDYDGAYATKRELIDLMESLRLQGAFEMEMEDSGITVYG